MSFVFEWERVELERVEWERIEWIFHTGLKFNRKEGTNDESNKTSLNLSKYFFICLFLHIANILQPSAI